MLIRLIAAIALSCVTAAVEAQPLTGPPPGQRVPPRDAPAASGETAAIAGRVTSAETGAPVRRALVIVTGGALKESRVAHTDGDGRYELKRLPAGRFTLSATRNGYLKLFYGQRRPNGLAKVLVVEEAQQLKNVDFALPRMSIIAGVVTDEVHEPLEGCTVTAYRSRFTPDGPQLSAVAVALTDASGAFRLLSLPPGHYWIQATSSETWTTQSQAGSRTHSYAPTYYPGAVGLQGAQPLKVGVGEELAQVEITLAPGRAVSVSGMAFNSRGEPLGGRTLFLAQDILTDLNNTRGGIIRMPRSAVVNADGSFAFKDVPTGTYRIETSVPSEQGRAPEAVAMEVTVVESDIEGLLVATTTGFELRGIVQFEGAAPAPAAGAFRMVARTRTMNLVPLRIEGENGVVGEDRTFVIRGITAPVLVRPLAPPPGWYLKSVHLGSRDITDAPVDAREVREPITVVLTNRATSIRGHAVDSRDRRLDDYTVIVFSADENRWGQDSRFVRATRADQAHEFVVANLPPGDYFIAALDDVEADQWLDPGFLAELKASATPLTLGDGDQRTLELKIASGR